MPKYSPLIDDAILYARAKTPDPQAQIPIAMDRLFVDFGTEILKLISGVVSTEVSSSSFASSSFTMCFAVQVDARLSFDTQKTIERARSLIAMYEELGISRERILIKIASTWEGIRAAEVLEKEGIRCNL